MASYADIRSRYQSLMATPGINPTAVAYAVQCLMEIIAENQRKELHS